MKHEEIDRLLAELPALGAGAETSARSAETPLAARPPTPVREAYRAIAARSPVCVRPDSRALERPSREAEEARAKAHAERIRRERKALTRRLSLRLTAALQGTRTPCVLLLGPTGIGKTSAMHWVAAEWPGYFVHARELASAERRYGLGDGYPPELDRARRERYLYLDDLGAEDARDLGTLQFVLDVRYARGLATVATSGLREDELRAHLGAPYYRRLVDQHVGRRDGSEWPVLIIDAFVWPREQTK